MSNASGVQGLESLCGYNSCMQSLYNFHTLDTILLAAALLMVEEAVFVMLWLCLRLSAPQLVEHPL